MLRGAEFRPFPRASDRAAWAEVAARPWVQRSSAPLLERAEQRSAADLCLVKATDYLSFFRTGRRDAHNVSAGGRQAVFGALLAAECLEGEGRFLDGLLDVSWALAEETSWIMPPHLPRQGGWVLPDVERPVIDLRVAGVGRQLGELTYVLGEQMDSVTPLWRGRLNAAIRRQVIEPYLGGSHHWETGTSNWNAVCTCGVVAAALLADFDLGTRARVLHRALGAVPHFLSGFTEDGGCSEGPGYWAYGVGNFAALAYYAHCATGGALDLLADPIVPRILSYPTNVVLTGRKVANFADCGPEVSFRSGAVAWAAERLGLLEVAALASGEPGDRPHRATVLDLWLASEPRPFEPPARSFLPDLMLLVTRGAGAEGEQLVLAAKGGHNGEHHNHNDVGTFIVHWRGRSLICDLGAGDYIKQLFSEGRYELLSTRSLGHDVPLVNGCEQGTGAEFRASDLVRAQDGAGDGLSMELAGAYPPEAGLRSLRRTVRLRRDGSERVELTDEIEFSYAEGRYELTLYTEGAFEAVGEGVVRARAGDAALDVAFEPGAVNARIETVEHGDSRFAARFGETVPRCMLGLKEPARRAVVRLTFAPVA
jgi:hypothetical protein